MTKLLWKWHRKLCRETGEVYMDRWQLLRTRLLSVYVNRINLPDYDELPHNHPWRASWSLKLKGRYVEEVYDHSVYPPKVSVRVPPRWSRIPDVHRISQVTYGGVWTLFVGWRADQPWGFVEEDGVIIPHQERKAQRGIASD